MAQVVWTEPALQDLDRIADYISLDNPAAAKDLVRKAFRRVERLNQHPKLGKSVQALKESIYRELVVPRAVFSTAKRRVLSISYMSCG